MDEFINDYLAFKPFYYLREHHPKIAQSADSLKKEAQLLGIDKKRAQALIDQLPVISDSLPDVIKSAIWKLQILSVLAQLYAKPTIEDAILMEKISTYAIKAKLADYSLWGSEDIEVIEETLDLNWVILMANNYDLKQFEQYAKVLRDKISLKEEAKQQVSNPKSSEYMSKVEELMELGHEKKDLLKFDEETLDLMLTIKNGGK